VPCVLADVIRELVEVCHTQRDLVWTDIHDYDGVADFRSFFESVSPAFLNTGPVRSKQARHEAGRLGMA
jgi:hypothetical protein